MKNRDQPTEGSETGPTPTLLRVLWRKWNVRLGLALVLIVLIGGAPLLVVSVYDPDSNPIGLGFLFACTGWPGGIMLLIGVLDGCSEWWHLRRRPGSDS